MENQTLEKDLSLLFVYGNVLQKIPNTSGWFVLGSKGINEQDFIHGTTERCRGDYSALPRVPPQAEKGEVVTLLLL